MDKPPLRRLNLSDLVILVAASAVGVLILRTAHEARAAGKVTSWVPPWSRQIGWEVTPFVISIAAGLLVARSLPPRPPWRRLLRQPGVIACLVILTDVSIDIILRFGNLMVATLKGYLVTQSLVTLLNMWTFAGRNVALSWVIQALVRAWRPEPSWIDRAGRGLGVLAIVLWLSVALNL